LTFYFISHILSIQSHTNKEPTISTTFKINNQIKASQVRVIDENAQQIGTISTWEALKMANERGLDVVEISPTATPPVVKLMDYGKYLFDEKKKEKESRRKERESRSALKDIQISPVIQDNDLGVKISNIRRIFGEGDKCRVIVKFSGRQMRHIELAKTIFDKIIESIPEALIERQPEFQDRNLSMVIYKNPQK
jgi:translation initiation factor IF-3